MKAATHTHHSKLIADITPKKRVVVTNRRGHVMARTTEIQTQPQPVQLHTCFVHNDAPIPLRTKFLSFMTGLVGGATEVLLNAYSYLPAWSPKKYTAEKGLQTNWAGALPERNVLLSSASLAALLVIAGIAVWHLPQRTTPPLTPKQPISVLNDQVANQPSQGVLSLASQHQDVSRDQPVWTAATTPRPSNPVNRSSTGSVSVPAIIRESPPATVTPPVITPPIEVVTPPVVEEPPVVVPEEPIIETPPIDPVIDLDPVIDILTP